MAEKMGPIISTNGLVFCVDVANPQSIVSGQTTWRDLTFNATGGTLTNGVGFSGTGVSSGLLFDGTDDYVNISSDQPFTPRTGLTIESWSNATDITTNRYYEITRRQSLSGGGFPTYLLSYQEYGNVMSFGLKTNVTYNELDIVINSGGTNSWLSYVATWDGTKKRLYRNGSNIGQNEQSGTIDDISGAITAIGRLPTGNSEYFKGRIAYVSNYNRGLSPFEVYQNFNALKGRYGIPDIVTGGLVLNLDAGNPYSYSPDNTGSTVWSDVSYTTTGGTLVNGTYYTGGTMTFDGTNDYVNCGNISTLILSNNQFTFSCWFTMTGTGTSRGDLFNIKNFNASQDDIGFFIDTNNKLYAFFQVQGVITVNVGTYLASVSNTTFSRNTIYNIVCIKDASQKIVMYVNGVLDNNTYSTVTNTANVATTPLWFGSNKIGPTTPASPFAGNIYSTQVYNRALSATEVQQNFNALRGRYGI